MQTQANAANPQSTLYDAIATEMAPLPFSQLRSLVPALSDEQCQAELEVLQTEGKITATRRGDFTLPERLGLVTGTVIGHRDGFGFLSTIQEGTDLFLPAKEMRKVFHGDLILAAPSNLDQKSRREGKVMRVLKQRKLELVGRFFVEGQTRFVVPDDPRVNHDIVISKEATLGARQGQVVVVQVTQRPVLNRNAEGKVLEILGENMAPGMEVEVALRNHDIPHTWPAGVSKAVQGLADTVDEKAIQGRVDLRSLPLVTIDGEDARDFDDAVYCEAKKSGGWRLWVAIADVSYYVRPDGALDREAYQRGNSVYFPDQVIPMLPEQLSNGLCSLNPDVDRLCMVAEMTISAAGRLSGYKFYEAVMHSHARLTYNKVAAILDGDELLTERYAEQVPHLQELHSMYHSLKQARALRGGIELETQETRFIFNAQRKIEQIVPTVRNDAHKIIEECMIQANVAAAKYVEKNKLAILYRVHDVPSDQKLITFRSFLSELGLSLEGGAKPDPKDYFKLVEQIQGRQDLELVQTMLLRSMMQAVYQPDNIGHFGLALGSYAHFTSPIRRYPDLLLHRVLKWLIAKEQAEKSGAEFTQNWTATGGRFYHDEEMENHGEHCSMTERRADDATREVSDALKCEYMLDHVGMIYPGTIAAVTGFGFFVRLDEFHIDGLVHISALRGDYYQYDAARQLLVGENTGRRFRIGDSVKVKVASVNMDDRKLEFVLVNKDGVADEFERPKPKHKSGKSESSGEKKKQRHRDGKNKGKRRGTSAEKKAAKGSATPWDNASPKSADKKPKAKPKKKRKQRAGKKERAAKKNNNG